MSSIAELRTLLAAKNDDMTNALNLLNAINYRQTQKITALEQEINDLALILEAKKTELLSEKESLNETQHKQKGCLSSFQKAIYDLNIELQRAEQYEEPHVPSHPERTKLKWVNDFNPEIYRVAIVIKNGILEVKRSGTDPHRKIFFENETSWRNSLPPNGTVTVTLGRASYFTIQMLSTRPLSATTDALKLKELEERFPGAVMMLNTPNYYYEIGYEDDGAGGHITNMGMSTMYSKSFKGFIGNDRLRLMAEWRGHCFNLSHLF